MSGRRITLRDVAQASNTSVSTASKALRRYKSVKPATRKRVENVAKQLGYALPQRNNKRDSADESGQSAARVPGLRHVTVFMSAREAQYEEYFYKPVVLEISQQGQLKGFDVRIVTGETIADVEKHVAPAVGPSPDALIICSWDHPSEAEGYLLQSLPVPVVMVNRYVVGVTNSVTHDDFGAGVQAARYLLGLGHRRIACLTGVQSSAPFRERAAGFRLGLEMEDAFDPQLFQEIDNSKTLESTQKVTRKLLNLSEPPTAIWAYSDVVASFAMLEIKSAGIRVPEEISIMGFDNLPPLRDFGLTTFTFRSREFGRQAIHLLHGLLTKAIEGPLRVCVSPELVERSSTAKAPERR